MRGIYMRRLLILIGNAVYMEPEMVAVRLRLINVFVTTDHQLHTISSIKSLYFLTGKY